MKNVTMGYMWSFFGAYMSKSTLDGQGGPGQPDSPSDIQLRAAERDDDVVPCANPEKPTPPASSS